MIVGMWGGLWQMRRKSHLWLAGWSMTEVADEWRTHGLDCSDEKAFRTSRA